MKQPKNVEKPQDEKPQGRNRKSLTYFFSVALLLVIAITFIGAPTLGSIGRRGRVSFGEYAGDPIVRLPGNYFDRRIQDWARYFGQQGAEESNQTYYQIFQFAYSDTVLHMARLHEATRIGGGVSTEFVDLQVAKWPAFQVDGRFSTSEFESMSSPDLLSLREFLRDLAIAEQVQIDTLATSDLSEPELEFLTSMASPEYRFRYVEFGFDSFPEGEVVRYGEENPGRFTQINISQITIDSSLADAESIRGQAVDRTASFEDLARNQSSDEYNDAGGERGWVYNWDLEFDFEDLANLEELVELSEGEISPVYETAAGWRIYRVNEIPIEPDFTDETTLAEVRSYLSSFERGRIEDYLRIAAEEFVSVAGAEGFETAATGINQLPQLTDYFPVNYGNTSFFSQINAAANSTISSAGAYREEFLRPLFALKAGEVSEPLVLRDYVFVFELDDVRILAEEDITDLEPALRNQLQQRIYTEGNQSMVDEDLYVDNFIQTYGSAVLGQ